MWISRTERKLLFINSCLGVTNISRNGFGLRMSTPQTPERTKYACWRAHEDAQERDNPTCHVSEKWTSFEKYHF